MQSEGHGVPSWNFPSVPQLCGVLPLHCVELGTQDPVHAPPLHTNGHAGPLLVHCPLFPQVCGWVLEHCFAPGEQVPHCPCPKHTPPHGAALSHWPAAPHVCGTLPLHCVL